MAWVRTNTKTGTIGSGTTVATTAFTAALTNPSLIVVWVDTSNTALTINGVSDTAGNTYTPVAVSITQGASVEGRMFYALNISSTASNVVTATMSGTITAQTNIIALEYTGGATSSPTDGYNAAGGQLSSADVPNAGSITTTGSSDLIVCFARSSATETWAKGTGFTTLITGATGRDEGEEILGAAASTYTGAFGAILNNSTWVCAVAAFLPAGGGPTTAIKSQSSASGVTFNWAI